MLKYLQLVIALILVLANSMSWAGKPVANKPPTVALTAPANGTTYAAPASITLTATAADTDGTVQKVEFFRNGILIASKTSAPYSVTWTNVPAGSYSLTAKATDNGIASTTSTAVSVTVTGAQIAISSPANGATIYSNNVAVTGAYSGDATTTKVWVNNGNSSRLAVLSGTTFAATVPIFIGANTLNVSVVRANKTSDSGSVTVTGADYPKMAFTAPATGTFNSPANVTLAVDAVSPSGSINKVDFFNGATLLKSIASPPYQFSWTNVPVGNYNITAQAVDNLGYTGSASTSINVLGPNVAPSVSITSPENNANYQAPASITLTANATDTDGTISMVEFYQGGVLLSATNLAPYTYTMSGVAAGDYSFTAKATDDRGGATTSAPVTVTVLAGGDDSIVHITSPASSASFTAPATVNLVAATSARSVGVRFFDVTSGSEIVIGDSPNTASPYTFSWKVSATGTYKVVAKAAVMLQGSSVPTWFASPPVTLTVVPNVSGETITYLHNDLLGSVIAATDINGSVLWKENYQPYGGRIKNEEAALGNRQFFTGKPHDEDTGLSYFGARYYDPVVGRFMGIDPVEFKESNIHSFNRYAYGNNNPYRFVDPDGREPYDCNVRDVMPQLRAIATSGDSARASSWHYQQSGNLADALLSGAVSAPGAGVVKSVSGLFAKEGAAVETVQRWMSKAELSATQETGLLRGGREGTHYVTDAANADALRARQRLALPQTPEVRVTLEVPGGTFSAPSKVEPKFNMPGGGGERTATGNISVKIRGVN
jgi:RHS repeat-associated protein